MKRTTISILLLIWMCSYIQITAQEQMPKMREDGAYYYVDQMPQFMDSREALGNYLAENIKFPEEAKEEGISGRVFIQFVVEEDGTLASFKVMKGVHPLLDEEALRVIKTMPRWNPGIEKGKKVRVIYTIPIVFENDSVSRGVILTRKEPAGAKIAASLEGVWQICNRIQPLDDNKYQVWPGTYMKILSADKNFVNMYLDTTGGSSVITAKGTYRQTSDSTYVESISKSVTDPEITGIDNELKIEFITENLLYIIYNMPGRTRPGKEVWLRIIQPDTKQRAGLYAF